MATSVSDELWPPQSARQALLSSPSGKRKFAAIQNTKNLSPLKATPGSTSLLDRLRLARNNQEHETGGGDDDDEDDEETLQLKLAAIEAKLKLKKLQNKTKKREKEEDQAFNSRPHSGSGSAFPEQAGDFSQVEVKLSPVKRPAVVVEQRSPSRVLLGIDKGKTGADVSLRRARIAGSSPSKDRSTKQSNIASRNTSRSSTSQNIREGNTTPTSGVKSFSERMAEVRGNDKKHADKREQALRTRASGFKIDVAEMARFKAAVEESHSHVRPRSPCRDDSNRTKDSTAVNTTEPHRLKKAKTLPDLRDTSEPPVGNADLYEGFSGVHLSSRILPHSFLKRTLPPDRLTTYRIPDLLKNVTSPAYEIPDEVGDFVIFGIIASKSNPLDQKNRAEDQTKTSNEWEKKWDDGTQNRKKFMVMTLTDLRWTIDLYLFGTAVPRYHRLTMGTVIAVLNPSIMPPKRGREDTGAFSLSLHDGDDTVLEIGSSRHLGYCNAVKKDGKECGQWVNAAKTEICEWHLNAQIAKTQSKRMGVNTGANGFGSKGSQSHAAQAGGMASQSKGQGPVKKFDWTTGSHYYMAASNTETRAPPLYNPDVNSARMIDLDDDDPFIAEGQFSRDREGLLQKRMASQEKERDIARRLAQIGGGSGAGATYMRQRTEETTSHKPIKGDKYRQRYIAAAGSSLSSADATAQQTTSRDLRSEIGKKRTADDVRLSPVKKKTRFLTEKGIKEAGRESLGLRTHTTLSKNDSDDDNDDDLDIV